MARLYVPIADGSGKTGALIQQMLTERGHTIVPSMDSRPDAVISYGRSVISGEVPTLNGSSNGNKFEQLVKLQGANIPVPTFAAANRAHGTPFKYPILARRTNHHGGTDIAITMQPEDINVRIQQGANFFTEFIPVKDEYRVWIYRRRHLGTYKKYLKYPEKYKRVGRNYQNGFAFELVPAASLPRNAVDLAASAVEALGLDFGAVDILESTESGKFYVLEVNTAPGVEGEHRQVIQSLVDKFVKWSTLKYPKRKGS